MDYPNKTFTNAGADLMAADDASNTLTVVDQMIVSQSAPDQSGQPLSEVTVNDFDNPMHFQINNRKHQDHTFQVEAVLNNDGLEDDYPINMIGLLAHSQGANNGNETLLAVATADDPFILPKQTNTPFNFSIGMALTYKNSQNITAELSDAGTVSVTDLKQFKIDAKKFISNEITVAVNQTADSYAIDKQNIKQLSSNISSINSTMTSNQNQFASSASNTISSNNNTANINTKATIAALNQEAEITTFHKDNVAIAALNQAAADNKMLKNRILG